MDRYPVAGQVIGLDLWFGISLRDIVESTAIPMFLLFVPRAIAVLPGVNINTVVTTIFGVVGLILGIVVLVVKDEEKRPLQYVFAQLGYYLTPTEYHKRRARDTDLGDVQEVHITQMDNDDD